jgi:hypothetical protein
MIALEGARLRGTASMTTLAGTDPDSVSSMKAPQSIALVTIKMGEKGNKMRLNLPAFSLVSCGSRCNKK